jgi:hypothetical protein
MWTLCTTIVAAGLLLFGAAVQTLSTLEATPALVPAVVSAN